MNMNGTAFGRSFCFEVGAVEDYVC